MDTLAALPLPLFGGVVFLARIVDVSLGTLRTLAIVSGNLPGAVILGFIEVSIWITVVSQVVLQVPHNPWLGLAFAGGFATGNAVGLLVERRISGARAVLRLVAPGDGDAVARGLRALGQVVTTFAGQGQSGPVTLIYAMTPRARVAELVAAARGIDPSIFYVVERADAWRVDPAATTHPGGWRAWWKKK